MGNICGSKLPKPNNENESDNAQVVPSTMSEGNLQQHNKSNNIAPISIKRQPTDSSVDSDVYASVKGPKGERLSMLQKKDTITDSLKGASHATQKLVHDSDANDKMKLWDVYELTTKGKGKFLGKGATATVRLIQHKETKKKYALKTVQLSKVLSKSKKRSFKKYRGQGK